MARQAAMFAGFAFEQITEPVPASTPFLLEATGNDWHVVLSGS